MTAQWVNPTAELTPLEIAASVLLGPDPDVLAPIPDRSISPRLALERSLVPALERPPCLIAFSGGRDSSALLALASYVAGREGLPGPVPITARYPGLAETDEQTWQERVITHLGLEDWVVLGFDDEVDLVGPVARELMLRRGLPYPYNLHLQQPLTAQATGGSFITGLGGDEAFMPAARTVAVLAGYVHPTPRDVLRIASAAAPRSIRRRRLAKSETLAFPWLSRDANHLLTRSWIETAVRIPLRWDASVADWWRSRYVQLTLATLSRLGEDLDVRVHQPFADGAVIAALAAAGGRRGFPSRSAALQVLFGDLLPVELPRRESKASFNAVLWNRHSKAFAAQLLEQSLEAAVDAAGLGAVVDTDALRAHWGGADPAANSFLLLQACWLAMHGDPVQL